jgi:hypothetical protein
MAINEKAKAASSGFPFLPKKSGHIFPVKSSEQLESSTFYLFIYYSFVILYTNQKEKRKKKKEKEKEKEKKSK